MKTIWKKLIEFFAAPKWKPLGTIKFSYVNKEGLKVHMISATYLVDQFDNRKMSYIEPPDKYGLYRKENHPYYHDMIVPFIHKTGWGANKDANLQECIDTIIGFETPKEKKPKLSSKSDGNVINLFEK